MKLNFNKIITVFTVWLLAALLFTSCATEVDNSGAAYLEVNKGLHWKNTYQVGESLSLDGLTAQYYSDVSEINDYETVTLTESMITGFDTSKEGSFTMTVTYKGKTATVGYTVVAKATPFEIKMTFGLGENILVSVDSASLKATVLVFDNYFKALENQPTKTEEKTLSYHVGNAGTTYASFAYNGSEHRISFDSESGLYYLSTTAVDGDASSLVSQLLHAVSPDTLQAPPKNVVYKSELKDQTYYSIAIDDAYNAVVTKHTVEGDTTVDTLMDSYTAKDAVLTTGGLLRYALRKDGHYATATFSKQGQFKIRKEADGALDSVYSVLCAIAE